ncbi:Protein FAR1-RELATED SEQUENCE 9 [Linum grandiflorum]
MRKLPIDSSVHFWNACVERKNASKNMGLELAGKVFKNGLTDVMYYVYTVDQFHSVWNRMIATTFPGEDHGGHPWLERIYKFHEQWSSAWVDNNRTCGMRSSQLSESFNASLRGYLDTKNNLPSFFREFARMLGGKREDESNIDYYANVVLPLNHHPRSKLIRQAAEVYTPQIFELFQKKFSNTKDLHLRGTMPTGIFGGKQVITWYRDCQPTIGRSDGHQVTFYVAGGFQYHCTYRLFDSCSWLCRHILKTMDIIGILWDRNALIIPSHYLLNRWKLTTKSGPDLYRCAIQCLEPETAFGRFQRLCGTVLLLANSQLQTWSRNRLHSYVKRFVQS